MCWLFFLEIAIVGWRSGGCCFLFVVFVGGGGPAIWGAMANSLAEARRTSLQALAAELGINGTTAMTKAELSNGIWAAVRHLIARVNEGQVSSIALVLWVWVVLGGRVFASFLRLFFLVSCFPFVGSSLPALRGARRCLL